MSIESLVDAVEAVDSAWHNLRVWHTPLGDQALITKDLQKALKDLCDELDYYYGAPRPDDL